jgi:uncharacterized protein
MKFGLRHQEYEMLLHLAIGPLKKCGARVWLFGSRARGDHRPSSDIDLLYESPTNIARTISEINEALEESRLPFKVDIVKMDELAQSYRENVLQDRVEL